jgi:hypothetical protein
MATGNVITVQFFGVCTHMSATQPGMPPSLAWGRRIVLVDASADKISNNFYLRNQQIEAHVARLQLKTSDIVTMSASEMSGFSFLLVESTSFLPPVEGPSFLVWDLNAMIFSIPNEMPPNRSPTGVLESMPSLAALTPALGAPSAAVTLNTVPTQAAAFFDVFSGEWTNKAYDEAYVATIQVTTIGAPVLRIRSFTNAEPPITIQLRSGAIVTLSNLEPSGVGGDYDFALHYLTAASFPESPGINTDSPSSTLPIIPVPPSPEDNPYNVPFNLIPPPTNEPDVCFGITPSCSNSTYP